MITKYLESEISLRRPSLTISRLTRCVIVQKSRSIVKAESKPLMALTITDTN